MQICSLEMLGEQSIVPDITGLCRTQEDPRHGVIINK